MGRGALELVPLYPSEEQIARLVLGPDRAPEWSGIATVLERSGLPAKDPVTGRRYYPAVKAFFDRRHAVATLPAPAKGSMEKRECKQPPARRQA